jgi:predicted dehydrogenase
MISLSDLIIEIVTVREKIRMGVVGVGYLGRFHALIYSRMPDVELVGVVDQDPARAQIVAQEAHCPMLAHPSELLGVVDAVSIVVPTSAHLEVARPFLQRGVHTLLEKPIAPSREEGQTIVALAESGGALLQIGHVERFNAGVMALAQRIDQPRFIEAHRMGGFVGRATDVDVVSDLMIHDIDIILSLVPAPISSIAAVGTPVLTPHVDIANARLEFANGTVANVVASRVSESKMRRIRVFQPNAYLSLDFAEQTLDIARPQPKSGQQWPDIARERLQPAPVKPLDVELAAFVDTVRSGQAPLVDGRVGLAALEVALQVREKILS